MRSIEPFKLLFFLLSALLACPTQAAPDRPAHRVDYYDAWLLSVQGQSSETERRRFLSLTTDLERELFIRSFWQARETADGTNLALERWQSHFEIARHRFRNLASDRAQSLMLAGSPSQVVGFGGCGGPIRHIEVWAYSPSQSGFLTRQGPEEGFYLAFVSASPRHAGFFRQWSPHEGLASLLEGVAGRRKPATLDEIFGLGAQVPCGDSKLSDLGTLRSALGTAWSAEELGQRVTLPAPDPAWLEASDSEFLDPSASLSAAHIEFELVGTFKWRVVLRGRLHVPVEEIARNAEGLLFDRLVIVGDIRESGRLIQPFRVIHHVAGHEPNSDTVALDFYRRLRPGTYELSLRVEDGEGLPLLREEHQITVSWVDQQAVPPAGFRRGLADLLRPEVVMLTTFPSVQLLASGDELMAGEVEIAAVTTGGPIAHLDFLLNGAVVGSDPKPPYSVNLMLGSSPEPQVLEVRALDPGGLVVAQDRAELNVGAPRFDVRFLEPLRERPSDRIRLAVAVPVKDEIDRVELYLDDERFAILREPPWNHPFPDVLTTKKTYLRAAAFLTTGEQTEGLVVIDPRPMEEIDVELVELYTSVVDHQGRPAMDLTEDQFRVFEDGEEQNLERFDKVENLSINVILLMDVSQSMRNRIQTSSLSAQRFFEKVLTPRDQASFLTFNDDIRLIVPFTNDVQRLHHGASGLRASGATRLYDSLIYTVHYFGGHEGKKALVLLSDGADVDSDFGFEQVLEYALRAGVATYPIGMGLGHSSNLQRLASETGGRYFAIRTASALDRVYRQIEQDLRSQYLLIYRPPTKGRTRFRRVEIEVAGDGLKARTLYGYYP